ncbi:MAG TPA: type II secretion system F family protein, partial [Victivallales bacterium]|nr:type II secretion system F family protein [Victivallales bacterium]
MPLYKYKVSDGNGAVKELFIDGDSHQDSMQRLRQRGFVPLEFYGEKSPDDKGVGFAVLKKGFDVCEFTNLLVPLISAHIPLEKALGILSQAAPNDDFAQTVNRIRKGLHEGKKFSALVRDSGSAFPKIYSNLIEAGEETGSMIEVSKELRRYLNERRETRNFLVTSSIYPAFVISVVGVVVILLFTVFIPKFSKLFVEMNKPMPFLTNCVFLVSRILTGYWWIWTILFILILSLISYMSKTGKLRALWDEYSIKVPIFGKLIIMAEIGRFVRTLAVLIGNHVNVLNSVSISVNVIGNSLIFKSFSLVTTDLKGGKKLSSALSRSEFMPKTALQMLVRIWRAVFS